MDESDANGEAGGRIELGSASAAPGTLDRGRLPVAELPTGGAERLPVVVANGAETGPTLWLTGGVHGDEATGVAVVQDAVAAFGDCLADLAGAVVAVPAVSPAGLRRNARETYYADEDPNRHFPDADAESARPPKLQERIDARLYAAITGHTPDNTTEFAVETVGTNAAADALIDCHTAGVGSEPFAIRDRVLYGDRRSESAAAALSAELGRLIDAFGFPVVREYPAAEYVEENLQRSTAGAVLNEAGVPAFTAELGAHSVVDDALLDAGVAGVFGVAVELRLLEVEEVPESVSEPGVGVDPAPVEFPVRRFRGPTTDDSGLVRHRVAAGDAFAEGDVLASVVDAAGAERATVRADSDGYVLGRCEGLAVYEGDPIGSLAVRDDGDLVVPRDADEE
ncbi:succinylglutamate desuccinylase/aspartoacylase family protein [Halorubrum distributum]|uniref:Succinylglutamate desuccinylase/aspartoacylase n=1 Tax=Halorubrum distributum JCM 13916 TaxID=1230455 RepID=M0PGR7_9EURY|nr:succinylglutamate desuccinylase/aspartoacylase family protein [Halorubrum arcis]EMA67955.1 succinylglutamate desuccinylase/aspartoacylase [Halorubrum arcis JCM 13916]